MGDDIFEEKRFSFELYWVEREPWLKSHGYKLRPRFTPDWVPSWKTDPTKYNGRVWQAEDAQMTVQCDVGLDATRINDGLQVYLKRVVKDSDERRIIEYLMDATIAQTAQRYVPFLEILDHIPNDPNYVLAVMPLLQDLRIPRFETIGECVDCVEQLLESVQFLHHHNIAHRTQRPPRYFLIDFGISIRFPASETEPQAIRQLAGDLSVPELIDPETYHDPYNPFPTDVYYLGNVIRRTFMREGDPIYVNQGHLGLEFLRPLLNAMTHPDPSRRPTIDEAVTQLRQIVSSLSRWKLRSRVVLPKDNNFGGFARFFPYLGRRIVYTICRVHPIPSRNVKA
ncbi:hypothetical protein CVT24_006660 [Panaeolus cyanescens]|uniref:Protein kinase domain-containing protein n=1 Tax=Panaeolus cyanescens TaxID=181874 RepID=A0A409YSJ6_9AGAR|nr:hypothetical protein CVT24_006660 [Panaeolus cyanescens]